MKKEIEYIEHCCCNESCNIIFFITEGHDNALRKNKKSFYCPNGHSMSYQGDTEAQRKAKIAADRLQTINQLTRELEQARKPKRKYNKKQK